MDHAASLPYVLAKTNFAGRVYMTHPTKAIYKYMMQDCLRVQNTRSGGGSDGSVSQLFSEQDVLSTLPQIQTISFHTTHTHNGIRFTPYPAGHVLGACMYLIEIAGLNILFTGDYSREVDKHLIPAQVPRNVKVDCLITESTFGISTHTPRQERETAFMKSVTGILNRGGRALLPVPAIGHAQELMLIFEDYWRRHEEYRRYPIYFTSGLARKCMAVYQTYIDAMNDNIRSKFQASRAGGGEDTAGPWDFQYIRSFKGLDKFEDVGGCVMLAAPGMMQNGTSRALLERWAADAKNGVVITGYNVEGTMARTIQTEPDAIPAIMANQGANKNMLGKKPGMGDEKPMIPRRCTVQEFSFALHVDGQENREFIEEVDAPVVILVHGEKHNMGRLKSRLLSLQKFKVFSPANCEEVLIPFRREKVARVVGRLASEIQPPKLLPSPPASEGDEDEEGSEEKKRRMEGEGQVVRGVLVQNDFKLSLMAPEDLKEYAGLTTTTILCRQRITLAAAGTELIRWALEGTFGTVTTSSASEEGAQDEEMNGMTNGEEAAQPTIFEIMGGAVRLICRERGECELEWEGNATNDSIADAVMAVLLTVESSPATVKQSSKGHQHHHHLESEQVQEEYGGFGDSPVETKKTNGFDVPLTSRRNPMASLQPEERLERLFMFLEAQFGADNITPIAQPKSSGEEAEADDVGQSKELARLHTLGIPVPGLEIRVDKMVAKVWLEGLEVECANKSLGDRVRAVVERGVETVAPLWR